MRSLLLPPVEDAPCEMRSSPLSHSLYALLETCDALFIPSA